MEYQHPKTSRLIQETRNLQHKVAEKRQAAFTRFPLLFTLLGTFGLVATFYGFEHIIDRIPILSNNPATLLLTGVITLIVTGTLYKKLQ